MKYLMLVLFACVSLMSVAQEAGLMPFTSKSPEAKQLLRNAWVAEAESRWGVYANSVKKALELDPDFALANFYQPAADTVAFLNNLKKAKSLSSGITYSEKLLIAASAALFSKKEDSKEVSELVRRYPKDKYLLMMLAVACQGTGHARQYLSILQIIAKHNPDFAVVYNRLGYAYLNTKDYPKAGNAFDKYIALLPNDANPYDSKGDYLMELKNYEEAVKMFEKAWEIDKQYTESKAKAEKARSMMPKKD